MKKRVIVIGGGASGLCAAIEAARGGAAVTVLEHTDKLAKKLLMTGNGKCNYTNSEDSLSHFHSLTDEGQKFIRTALSAFGAADTIAYFKALGILPYVRAYGYDEGGYVYPASHEARSVRNALLSEAAALNVRFMLSCRVRSVLRAKNQYGRPVYQLDTSDGLLSADALIFAGGAKAAPKTGSDGTACELPAAFGHMIWEFLPALCALRCVGGFFSELKGVRAVCGLKLCIAPADERTVRRRRQEYEESEADHYGFLSDTLLSGPYEASGEVQFTDYGISGIPAFQLSRYAALSVKLRRERYLLLDTVPSLSEEALLSELHARRERFADRTADRLLNGMLPEKLAAVVLRLSCIRAEEGIYALSDAALSALSSRMKAWRIGVLDTNGFDSCQCCQGGVDTREIDAGTMESKLFSELYFAGELIDVDGDCGGYNLQWAWTSGVLSGRAAAKIKRYQPYPERFETNSETYRKEHT